MIKIGLTGGIATGKSTVSKYVKSKGIPVIDCDILAKQAVEVGKEAYRQIINEFGNKILHQNREINRAELGNIIFNDSSKKLVLEQIVHKQVLLEINRLLKSYNDYSIVIIDIPLLFEAKLEYLVDIIWVVYCTPKQQLNRLMKRNNLTEIEALARINSQMPIEEKKIRANFVLDNTSDFNSLMKQVDQQLNKFI